MHLGESMLITSVLEPVLLLYQAYPQQNPATWSTDGYSLLLYLFSLLCGLCTCSHL